jgi:hypothetical protein
MKDPKSASSFKKLTCGKLDGGEERIQRVRVVSLDEAARPRELATHT